MRQRCRMFVYATSLDWLLWVLPPGIMIPSKPAPPDKVGWVLWSVWLQQKVGGRHLDVTSVGQGCRGIHVCVQHIPVQGISARSSWAL